MDTRCFLLVCFFHIFLLAGNILNFAGPREINKNEKKPKKPYQVPKHKKTKTHNGIIISQANIVQYRYYNNIKKNLNRLQEAYIEPIKEISTQQSLKIFNEAENVDKIVIKSVKDLSIDVFSLPKVKRVQNSIFEANQETIFCTWEILDENQTTIPVNVFYAINAKIINNLSAQYIYAPFVEHIDPAIFDNSKLKKIFVGPNFKMTNVPQKNRRFLESYSMEEFSTIHLLHLTLTLKFNDIIRYANYSECPLNVDKKKWKSLQTTIDNLKLIMEKQINPFSFLQ